MSSPCLTNERPPAGHESAGTVEQTAGEGGDDGRGERQAGQEQGLDNFDATTWNMVLLPKGTPAPIVQKLNAALSKALDTPTTQERLLNIGLDIPAPDKRSPEYAAKFVESEIKKYEGPIKAAGIVIE